MNKHTLLAVLAVGSLCAPVSSFAQERAAAQNDASSTQPTKAEDGNSGNEPGGEEPAPVAITTEIEFLKLSAQAAQANLRLAQLGLKRSRDRQVRSLAQTLVNEATQTSRAFNTLTNTLGFKVTPSRAAKDEAYTKLSSLKGGAFDTAFIQAVQKSQTEGLARLDGAGRIAATPAIKSYVSGSLAAAQRSAQQVDSVSVATGGVAANPLTGPSVSGGLVGDTPPDAPATATPPANGGSVGTPANGTANNTPGGAQNNTNGRQNRTPAQGSTLVDANGFPIIPGSVTVAPGTLPGNPNNGQGNPQNSNPANTQPGSPASNGAGQPAAVPGQAPAPGTPNANPQPNSGTQPNAVPGQTPAQGQGTNGTGTNANGGSGRSSGGNAPGRGASGNGGAAAGGASAGGGAPASGGAGAPAKR